jgi:hypothetical protein
MSLVFPPSDPPLTRTRSAVSNGKRLQVVPPCDTKSAQRCRPCFFGRGLLSLQRPSRDRFRQQCHSLCPLIAEGRFPPPLELAREIDRLEAERPAITRPVNVEPDLPTRLKYFVTAPAPPEPLSLFKSRKSSRALDRE